MLQKLNERIQGVVAWLVIILIAITFTLFGVDYYLQSHQTNNAKALVNGQPLTQQAFEVNYRRARAQEDMAQLTTAEEKRIQEEVLNQMITNEVTIQAAHRFGFEVSVAQANAAILSIPQFQEDGHFSAQRYQQALSSALFTSETFQNEVKQGMLLNQQRFAFIGSSFALPEEVNRFVRLYLQTRDYDYLILPASRFEKEAVVSESEQKKYYKKHLNDFKSPEYVSVEYVMLSINDIRAQANISDVEVKRYYDENQGNFLSPAQWKVAHLLFAVPDNASLELEEQIKKKAESAYQQVKNNPEQFTQFVRSSSDDKLSIPSDGQLPWLTAGQSEYDKVLSQLNQPNQISAPEKTKFGYEIFKLIEYKPAKIKSFNQVEKVIREQLIAETTQTQYAQALEQLTDLSYQTPDSLNVVSNALKLPIQTSEPFSRDGGHSAVTQNKQVVNSAFSHDVLELANNSEPLQLDNDSVVVLRVKDHVSAKINNFQAVKAQIQNILARQYASKKAMALGALLVNPMGDKDEAITKNRLKWQFIKSASRDHDKVDPLINDLAFNLLKAGDRNGVSLSNGDYAVVRLKIINDGNLNALDKEQRDSLVQQIEASFGMIDYELYVKNLLGRAQVVMK